MTRAALYAAALIYVAALYFGDRIMAGVLQCESAHTCPVSTLRGGRP